MVKSSPGYAANRARISLAVSQFTVPMLSDIYRAFDGDMVCALVLGEIAHRNVEAWLKDHDHSEAPLYDRSQRVQVMRPCNALSIAEACGLPRETVRRKVVVLISKGFVYRSEEGHLYLAETVGDQFEEQTARLVEDLLATAQRLQALLAANGSPIGPLWLDTPLPTSQPIAHAARS